MNDDLIEWYGSGEKSAIGAPMRVNQRKAMSRDAEKILAAQRAVEFVRDGQLVGLGTGSTAAHAIRILGKRVEAGLSIQGVPTSNATEQLAREVGIELVSLNQVDEIDITIDGADEVDPQFNMIKGGGGALTREKLVAVASKKRVIAVDQSKLVDRLGARFPIPVEVLPFGFRVVARALDSLGCHPKIREINGAPFVTDNMNWIVDCASGPVDDPLLLEQEIKQISGVVECGLFARLADVLVIACRDDVTVLERGASRNSVAVWNQLSGARGGKSV